MVGSTPVPGVVLGVPAGHKTLVNSQVQMEA